jgi:DNA-binding response OmpR family regulator
MEYAKLRQEKAGPDEPRRARARPTWVLLAEHNDGLRRELAMALSRCGYEVVEATDGRAAVDRLLHGHKPSLIIADLWLPDLSGLGLVELVRRMEWATPVMVMTTGRDPEARAKALRLGAAAVIPIHEELDVSDLCAFVRGAVPPG